MPKKNTLILLGIVCTGFLLRLIAVLKFGDFWFDEIFSYIYSQKPWLLSWHFWTLETNPPLHMIVLKLWFMFAPANEFFARIVSLTFGVATVVAVFTFAKKIFNKSAALVAALLMALYPYAIFFSAMARGYSLLMLLTILCLDAFYTHFFSGKKTNKTYAYLLVTHVLILYTHLTAGFVIISELLVLAMYKRSEWKEWSVLYGLVAFAWLPWAAPTTLYKATKETVNYAWFFNIHVTPRSVINTIGPLFGAFGVWHIAWIPALVAMYSIAQNVYRSAKENALSEKNFIVLSPLIVTGASVLLFGLWNNKFTAVAIPCAAVALGQSLQSWKILVPIKIFTIAFMLIPGLVTLWFALPMQSWQPLNRCMNLNRIPDTKQIFVYLNFIERDVSRRYYHGSIPTALYYPEELATTWDYDLITKNYWRSVHSKSEVEKWAQQNQIVSYDTVFTLATRDENGVLLGEYLIDHGFRETPNACRDYYLDNQMVRAYQR